MATPLEKQLRAAQKFLASVRHLPSFEEAKARQVEVLTKKMAALPVSVEQAAALVEVLDASIWAGSLDELKASVRIEEPGVDRKNTPLQDYMAIPKYLSAALWKSLSEDPRKVALEKLCRHCQLLGLSNASEVTQGMILCLVFDLEGKLLGTQQWGVTLREKGNVQKFLKQPKQQPFVLLLPRDCAECPEELLRRALGDEGPIECPVAYEDLLARAKDWPMRSTHRYAQKSMPMSLPCASAMEEGVLMSKMGHFMAGFVQGHSEENVSLPGLKLFPREAKKEKQPVVSVLALEDKKEQSSANELAQKKEGSEMCQGGAQSRPALSEESKGQAAVAATLAALQGEAKNKTGLGAKVKSKPSGKTECKKKPAGKSKKKPALRRPAAAVKVKRPRARRGQEGESREAKRLRLINAWVPKDLQRKYRDGCSKCYHRSGCTLSCWRLRGFEMTD